MITAAMVAGVLVGAVSPARADEASAASDCRALRPVPGTTTVTIGPGGLIINLDGRGPDVAAMRAWATATALDIVACVTDPLPIEDALCVAGVVSNIGSYIVVSPPIIQINYPALVQDLAPCLLST
jgi:hypothetical protein